VQVRAEVIPPNVTSVVAPRPLAVLRARVNLAAGFLGALTAAGLLLLVALSAALLTVLVGTTQRGAGALGDTLTEATLVSSLTMAGVLAGVVVLPFVAGGYVGARLAPVDPRAQGIVVWGWAVLPLALCALLALVSGGPARHGVTVVVGDPATTVLLMSGLALSLLGSLLGADLARRHPPAPAPAP
jgi:hypothetical protein